MTKRSCKFCRSFHRNHPVIMTATGIKQMGECRRYPKYWPKDQNDWCDEFKANYEEKQKLINTPTYIALKDKPDKTAREKQAVNMYEDNQLSNVPESAGSTILSDAALIGLASRNNEGAHRELLKRGYHLTEKDEYIKGD